MTARSFHEAWETTEGRHLLIFTLEELEAIERSLVEHGLLGNVHAVCALAKVYSEIQRREIAMGRRAPNGTSKCSVDMRSGAVDP